MKKINAILAFSLLALIISLTACNKPANDLQAVDDEATLIEEYSLLCDDIIESMKNGDENKFDELMDELAVFYEEIDSISPEEHAKVSQINERFNEQFMQFSDAFERINTIISNEDSTASTQQSK